MAINKIGALPGTEGSRTMSSSPSSIIPILNLGLEDTLLCGDMFWDLNKLLHNLLYIFNAPNSTNEQVPNDIVRLIDDIRKRPARCFARNPLG